MTTFRYRLSTFALVAFLILANLGCSGNSDGGAWIEEQQLQRFIQVYYRGLNWPIPMDVEPLLFPGEEVGYFAYISGNEEDKGIPFGDLVSKVEVNPGDGSGWLDFTQGYLDALPNSQIGTHVFDEAGSYKYLLRVTYWDGEVFLDDGLGQGIITILPPPDAGE